MGKALVSRRGGGVSGKFDKTLSGSIPSSGGTPIGDYVVNINIRAKDNPLVILLYGSGSKRAAYFCDGTSIEQLAGTFYLEIPRATIADDGTLDIHSVNLELTYKIRYC